MDKDRDRDRWRQRDRETDRQRDRETESQRQQTQRNRVTEIQSEKERDHEKSKEGVRVRKDRQAGRQRETDKQAGKMKVREGDCAAYMRLMKHYYPVTCTIIEWWSWSLDSCLFVDGFRPRVQGTGPWCRVQGSGWAPSLTCNGVLRHVQDQVHQNSIAWWATRIHQDVLCGAGPITEDYDDPASSQCGSCAHIHQQ